VGASGTTSTKVVDKEADAYLLCDTSTDKPCNYAYADRSGSVANVWCATVALIGTKTPICTDFSVRI
jgi:hypothetical protein